MIIYKDIFSGDELFSDTFKVETVENGCIYRVTGKMVSESTTVSDSMIGGNASAEGGEDEAADGNISTTGLNIAINHKLQESGMSKKDYGTYIKGYCKKLKEKVAEQSGDEEANKFQAGASAFVKTVIGNYKKYTLYQVESYDVEAMVPLLIWEEDDTVPIMLFFKHGVVAEKF